MRRSPSGGANLVASTSFEDREITKYREQLQRRLSQRHSQESLGFFKRKSVKRLPRKEQAKHSSAGRSDQGSDNINEIIVKAEMKKFKHLLQNRQKRINHLVSVDFNRIYPMNKINQLNGLISAPTTTTNKKHTQEKQPASAIESRIN